MPVTWAEWHPVTGTPMPQGQVPTVCKDACNRGLAKSRNARSFKGSVGPPA